MDVTTGVALFVFGMAVALRAAARTRARMKTLQRIAPEAPDVPRARWRPRPVLRSTRSRIDDELSVAARAMARAVRGGSSPVQAIAAAAEEAPHVAGLSMFAQQARQSGLSAGCTEWRRCDDRPGVRLVTAALEISGISGGSLARALDGVADTIEARAAVRREVRAQAATARASAAVLVVAPTVFAGFSLATDSSAVAFLTRTPAGLACLLVAVGLEAAGGAWMAKITGGLR